MQAEMQQRLEMKLKNAGLNLIQTFNSFAFLEPIQIIHILSNRKNHQISIFPTVLTTSYYHKNISIFIVCITLVLAFAFESPNTDRLSLVSAE